MPDQPALREALHDLVADVEAGDDLCRRIERNRGPRRHLLLAAAAVLVSVALVGAVLATMDDGPAPVVTTTGADWRELAPAPTAFRDGASVMWTGKEVLVWGGFLAAESGRQSADDGLAYDPSTDRWRAIPTAPIGGRSDAATAWTGTELLVWGGSIGSAGTPAEGGAAYDPERDQWRTLPPAPISGRQKMAFAWTGDELVVWGGDGPQGVVTDDGAAYDPTTDSWRPFESDVAPGPSPQMLWDGDRLVLRPGGTGDTYAYERTRRDDVQVTQILGDTSVPGGLPPAGRAGAAQTLMDRTPVIWGGFADGEWHADGWVLDERVGSWQPLPVAPPSEAPHGEGQTSHAVWTGSSLVIWPERLSYSPQTRRWERLPEAPVGDGRTLAVVAVGGDLLVWSAGGETAGDEVPGARVSLDDDGSPPATIVEDSCRPDLGALEPTYVPVGWNPARLPGLGSGAEAPGASHWEGERGSSIDVLGSPGPWPVSEEGSTTIDVLGHDATLGRIHEGYGVETACGFSLAAYGISPEDLKLFAEGLVEAADHHAFALWPETDARHAVEAAQRLAAGADPWRSDPVATAERFADDVLGWTDAVGTPSEDGRLQVRSGRRTADITVQRLLGGRWWSVTSVRPTSGVDYGASATFFADGASFGIGYYGVFATSEVHFFRAGRSASVTGTEPGGSVSFSPPWPNDRPGAILLLLKDADGAVIHATSVLVGPGDFAAG